MISNDVHSFPISVDQKGEIDIANIKKISKESLLAFVDKYIHPSSPDRTVLTVHVKSQIEPKATTFEDQLAEGVRLFITNEGYDIPPSKVTEAVKGDPAVLPETLYSIILSHGYDQERVMKSMTKGADMFKAQTEVLTNGNAHQSKVGHPNVLKEIRIDDVQSFRTTLLMDDKPVPVQPLETFHECESPRL